MKSSIKQKIKERISKIIENNDGILEFDNFRVQLKKSNNCNRTTADLFSNYHFAVFNGNYWLEQAGHGGPLNIWSDENSMINDVICFIFKKRID